MRKIEKVCIVETKSPSSHIFSFVKIFRLGSPLLGTILSNLGCQVKVFIEDIEEIYNEVTGVITKSELYDADLVCFSAITSTVNRAYEIADKLRSEGVLVAIGGHHVTFLPDEALERDCVDYVVRGEGEDTLTELIEHLNNNLPLEGIAGLSYKENGEIVHNPKRELIKDLDAYPIPDFSLVADWEDKKVIPIATSRGCPFACRFCSVIPMFGRQMRFKSVGRVIEEIKLALKYNPRHIFFIDDNFAANPKRANDICQAIIDNKLVFSWSSQVRTDIPKELIKKMAEAGCVNVFIGFESIDQDTLIAYDKKQKATDFEGLIKLFHKVAINIHAMFVIDPDKNSVSLVWETVAFAKKMGISSLQLLDYTPLPGTPVFAEMEAEGRLLHRDWSKYDAHHAVFRTKKMSVGDFQIEPLRGMHSFYNWFYSLKWSLSAFTMQDGRRFFEGLFYARIGFYGRRLTKEALENSSDYLRSLLEKSDGLADKKFSVEAVDVKSVMQNFGSL